MAEEVPKRGRSKAFSVLIYLGITLSIIIIIAVASAVITDQVIPKDNLTPTIDVPAVINGTINQTITINATVNDPEGNISSIIWSQESGPEVNITTIGSTLYFIPLVNGSYLFSIEVQDAGLLTASKGVIVNIGDQGIPPVEEPPIPIPPVDNDTTPTPPTPPAPQPTALKVAVVGDIDNTGSGNAVFNTIKERNPSNIFILGDLGYESDLDWFKSTYGTLGNKINCVIGNHEAADEDGSSSIETEAIEYCGESYYIKKGAALFFGFNTNGDLNKQLTGAKNLVTSDSFMSGVKTVHVMTHKPCATSPNAHHPVESEVKAFCDSFKSAMPGTIKTVFNGAHNHVLSSTADGQYTQSGAGGRSHYTCGVNSVWTFCDNTKFGFLEYTIQPDGNTTAQFIDQSGGIIK